MAEQIILNVPDISCGHCVATVEGALGKQNGVSAVSANENTKDVKIEFDPSIISVEAISGILAEEGYPVRS